MINQFCLLLQTIQRRILLGEGRVLNNLETTSLHTVASVSVVFFGVKKNERKMVWIFWQWEKWGESKIWNRGRGGKGALTDPVILKTLFGSDVACDYLSLNQLLCINH